jgi:hypothetical protein|tara:strand:- start:9462 stop:9872 length:411 start_codon:yes stop_codon:yes gene_type:complete
MDNVFNNFNLFEKELSKSNSLQDFSNNLELHYKRVVEDMTKEGCNKNRLEALIISRRLDKFFEIVDDYDLLGGGRRQLRVSEGERYLSVSRLFDALIYFSIDLATIDSPDSNRNFNSIDISRLCEIKNDFLNKYLI